MKYNRRIYRSGFEEKIKKQLEEQGIKFEYETQTWEYRKPVRMSRCGDCNGTGVYQLCKYTPDFILGSGVILECKGYLDGPDRTKLRLIREQFPDKDLRLVFQRDNVIKGTKNKTTYSQWAEALGYKWCIKEIPTTWLT
jgi:hypothetical protein